MNQNCKTCYNSVEYNNKYECTVGYEVELIEDAEKETCDNWESKEQQC